MERFTAPVRAVAMVEMALVTPVIVFLMISFTQLGFVFSSYVSVTNVAREAARASIVSGLTDAERRQAAVAAVFPSAGVNRSTGLALATGTIANPGGVTVSLPAYGVAEQMSNPNRRGQTLQVTVVWRVTMDIGVFFTTPDFNVTATSAMRIE